MSAKCKGCEKTVYYTERVQALDASWHPGCLKCQVCKTRLNLKNLQSYDSQPYCQSHVPKAKATVVADDVLTSHAKSSQAVTNHARHENSTVQKVRTLLALSLPPAPTVVCPVLPDLLASRAPVRSPLRLLMTNPFLTSRKHRRSLRTPALRTSPPRRGPARSLPKALTTRCSCMPVRRKRRRPMLAARTCRLRRSPDIATSSVTLTIQGTGEKPAQVADDVMTQHARSTQKIASYSHAENEGIQKGEFHGGASPRGAGAAHDHGHEAHHEQAPAEEQW